MQRITDAAPQYDRRFIVDHLRGLIRFYHPRCIDPAGGTFGAFRTDGSVVDPDTRHLVGTARMSVNYGIAYRLFGDDEHRDAQLHGLRFLRLGHRDARTGGYAWLLHNGVAIDRTNHCYGLAFCMLAYAMAVGNGLEQARAWLDETWDLLERRFWEPQHGLYADEASADWKLSGYRGQNANMHLCEALIAAYEATGEPRYVRRASLLADSVFDRLAVQCGGQVWEHYDAAWQIDWTYNKGDRSNIFRPWGLQPGHQIEWAKLLLLLDRHLSAAWRRPRAEQLFRVAVETAWDTRHEGLIYGYDPEGRPYDCDKYSWVQVEALATAAMLARETGNAFYRDWYARLARYCWRVFVDPRHGCWHRIRRPDNSSVDEEGCFSGLTDYHSFSACSDILKVL